MSVELRPLGVNCNLGCSYCYQNPLREAGNLTRRYDIPAMKSAILEEGGPFALFGGEPLLIPIADLEALWKWGLERFGRNAVQTNGLLVTDEHVRLFRAYRVSVGISIDGPGGLNDFRRLGSLEQTREATAKVEHVLERLCREGPTPSLIVTLHRLNASRERLPELLGWLRRLDGLGVRHVRLHVLQVEGDEMGAEHALGPRDNVAALSALAELEGDLELRFDVFRELESLLQGRDESVSCVWRACDPYTTAAVRGVEGLGQRSNCGRTNKEGVEFVKSDRPGYERYFALYHTPQEHGGCAGCRFFMLCKGQCPGTAIGGDWRNRTEHCEIWMELFERAERKMLAAGKEVLSLRADRTQIEAALLRAWDEGVNPSLEALLGR